MQAPLITRYGFSIRTRGGVLIEKLAIPAASAEQAESKLRQIYRECKVVARWDAVPAGDDTPASGDAEPGR
ncbi:MAG: hypothetical protein KF778_13455 [Rhodocyclaceae bacterium]|nr:hypothetical protein [Rhodocyclaceae bacterium]MBX3669402.1 hypothetical protein [Rhodocyclaceae bacterium]